MTSRTNQKLRLELNLLATVTCPQMCRQDLLTNLNKRGSLFHSTIIHSFIALIIMHIIIIIIIIIYI